MSMADQSAPQENFRLSMLLYDTRYRSLTIQVIFLILFMSGAAWLINNTISNLEALGKDFNYSFLGERAGYDINQRLVEYSSNSTHGRAVIVGLLNTLLVAFLGCIAATIIGVIAGVLRLSKNWIVARLMTVYIEMFRNVPVVLWIFIVLAIMSEGMDQPRDFRGDDPKASMILFDSVAITNRGIYVPRIGFSNSLGGNPELDDVDTADANAAPVPPSSSGLDWLLVLVVLGGSVYAARYNSRRAANIQERTGIRPTTWHVNAAIIILPTLLVMLALGATIVNPYLKGFNFTEGIHLRNSLLALWIALSVYTGAFIAENVRAGIMAINKGQSEASAALGLRPSRTMRLVILPQAMRVIVPPLISQYLNLTKNSSLAIACGYMDLRATLGGITLNQTGRELEAMLLMMLIYLAISLMISAVMNFYNTRTQLRER